MACEGQELGNQQSLSARFMGDSGKLFGMRGLGPQAQAGNIFHKRNGERREGELREDKVRALESSRKKVQAVES